jgi:hypothetical protein
VVVLHAGADHIRAGACKAAALVALDEFECVPMELSDYELDHHLHDDHHNDDNRHETHAYFDLQ